MSEKIQLRRSSVAGRVPTTSQLDLGEIGINTHDGKLYIKKDDGSASIIEVGGFFSLGDLIDVDLTGLADGQVLDYDGSNWIPVTPTDVLDNTTRNINATTYKFSTSTSSSPGNEKIQLNNSDWSAATQIYINKKDKDGRDLTNFYNIVLKAGTKVFIQENKDAEKLFVAELSSDATLSSSVFSAPLTNVQVLGSRPGNDKTSTFGIVYSPPQRYGTVIGLSAEDDENLGTFAGGTIQDNQTVKDALRDLEIAIEIGAISVNASRYKFSTAVGAGPGTGRLRYDSTSTSSVDRIYLHDTDRDGRDLKPFLDFMLKKGVYVYVASAETDDTLFAQLSADAVHTTDYYTIDLENIQIAGNVPSADEALTFGLAIGPAVSGTGQLNVANNTVPVYSDNTAAKAGGLVDGDVYRTSGGNLKIVYT